jgi:hypothetical protein
MRTPTDLERFASPVEQRLATGLVDHLLSLGYKLSVFDSEEWVVVQSSDRAEILGALASTGHDTIRIRTDNEAVGSVWLIWGNDEDLVSDYTHGVVDIVEPFLDGLRNSLSGRVHYDSWQSIYLD